MCLTQHTTTWFAALLTPGAKRMPVCPHGNEPPLMLTGQRQRCQEDWAIWPDENVYCILYRFNSAHAAYEQQKSLGVAEGFHIDN